MANFDIAIKKLFSLEFSEPKNALHKNKNEKYLTFMGIYEKYYPSLILWKSVKNALNRGYTLEDISIMLFNTKEALDEVKKVYKLNYWEKLHIDDIAQNKANMLFAFAVNVGSKTAIKILQKTLNVKIDGIIGKITLRALANVDFKDFEKDFKINQIGYYIDITRKNPNFLTYLKGWYNRVLRS